MNQFDTEKIIGFVRDLLFALIVSVPVLLIRYSLGQRLEFIDVSLEIAIFSFALALATTFAFAPSPSDVRTSGDEFPIQVILIQRQWLITQVFMMLSFILWVDVFLCILGIIDILLNIIAAAITFFAALILQINWLW